MIIIVLRTGHCLQIFSNMIFGKLVLLPSSGGRKDTFIFSSARKIVV
jgi:hypothetical protein